MGLSDRIDADNQLISAVVYAGGRRLSGVVSVTVDLGYDVVSASATVTLDGAVPSHVTFRQKLEVWLGWDGYLAAVFVGFVEDDGRRYFPQQGTIRGAGWLRLAQYSYPSDLSYSSQTDTAIVESLLGLVGVPERSIQGRGYTMGVTKAVTVRAGQPVWDRINELDQVWGYKTFDSPDGKVRRRRISGNPAGGSVWTYTEGDNIIQIDRPRTIRGVHNKVIVRGLPGTLFTPSSTRQATSPYVPTPPTYVPYEFVSDLIEDNTAAEEISLRLMSDVNKLVEEVQLEVGGNPLLRPGQTISVTAPSVGIGSATRYRIRHISHRMTGREFRTSLLVEGGAGEAGYEVDLDPEAAFTYRVTRETFQIWNGAGYDASAQYYTVMCDASPSWDPDGTIAAYSWSNNKNGDVGSASTYQTKFTAAQIATATITLTVTDNDGNTASVTHNVGVGGEVAPQLVRKLAVAAGSQAEWSPDGGTTWYTWAPGAGAVVSTPEIAPEDITYFGLSDGKLYRLEDWDSSSAPALLTTFDAQVNCIWVNEADNNRIWVGLANGKIHLSVDGGVTWTLKKTYGNPVLRLIESAFEPGQVRVAVGNTIRITYTEFADDATLILFDAGATARHTAGALGFGGYGCGSVSSGQTNAVQKEDGTVITFPALTPAVEDVRGIAHHIRDDVLFAVDAQGRSFRKGAGSTTFTQMGTLNGSGTVNHVIRDGDAPEIIYAAADDGLYKTWDGAATWVRLRDYTAVGLVGRQVGYGGAGAWSIAPVTVVSTGGVGKVANLWNGVSNDTPPAGWTDVGFADSGWAASMQMTQNISAYYLPPSGAQWVSTHGTGIGVAANNEFLFRQTFTVGDGEITAVTLALNYDDYLIGLWINGVLVVQDLSHSDPQPDPADNYAISPSLLVNGTNVIAAHVRQSSAVNSPQAISFRLEVR
jgi:hypothetical protein